MNTSIFRAADPDFAEAGGSQAVKAQQRLREWILAGELPSGARIAELALVERLGMSRTPIRAALMHLSQEGLLEPLPGGGYAVRTFSEREVADAIELRGTLEGLAARLAAERGVRAALIKQARLCLDQIDAVLQAAALSDESTGTGRHRATRSRSGRGPHARALTHCAAKHAGCFARPRRIGHARCATHQTFLIPDF